MKKRPAIVLQEEETKETVKTDTVKTEKPKKEEWSRGFINQNENNVNKCVGHALTSINQFKQLLYNVTEKWKCRHSIKVIGDLVEDDAPDFLVRFARSIDPLAYSGVFKTEDYWASHPRMSAQEYLKLGIIDGPVDGRGNKDTMFQVFITDGIRLTKEQEEKLTEFDKDIIHWASQSDPKHFFHYFYRRMHFDNPSEEKEYIDEAHEFLRKKAEAEEEKEASSFWVEMSHLLRELQEKNGPASQQIKDELAQLQGENRAYLEHRYNKSQVHAEIEINQVKKKNTPL